MGRVARWWVVVWGAAALWGCAGAPSRGAPSVQREAVASAVEVSRQGLYGAMQDAAASQQREVRTREVGVVARYNPARCACPRFEVLLQARWQRVELRWAEEASSLEDPLGRLARLGMVAEERGTHPLFALRLRLTGEVIAVESGLEYPVGVVSGSWLLGALPLEEAILRAQRVTAGRP